MLTTWTIPREVAKHYTLSSTERRSGMECEKYADKIVKSIDDITDEDGHCNSITIRFTDGTIMNISCGVHQFKLPSPFEPIERAHMMVS